MFRVVTWVEDICLLMTIEPKLSFIMIVLSFIDAIEEQNFYKIFNSETHLLLL
jgi:hypothetical protein